MGAQLRHADVVFRPKAPPPRRVVYDWTDYCNAKCFFCPREEYVRSINGEGGFVPFENIKQLAPVLETAETFCISSGIGEPLLHPELQQILEWLYKLNPKIRLQTVTNGTALTANKASWFAGHLDWLSVSLNAANGEAHMRDMFPHLAKRGIDPQKRWKLHVRHLTEFLAALPQADRDRVQFAMVTHRYNIQDLPDFVRLVKSMGGKKAVITNIAVHPHTLDWSLFWVKDEYNNRVEEACEIGAQIGVNVHGVRFYTSVKPNIDLDQLCRDPLEVAYISRSAQMAPCCQWSEARFDVDMDSPDGFDPYWNNDVLTRLRQKRDYPSCRGCAITRVFDETSFHFSPKLKKVLLDEGRLSEIDADNDYPESQLVLTCSNLGLDLPILRRTLR